MQSSENRQLTILWTSGDPITARHMVMMYARNALVKKWWDAVKVVIWGASTSLAAEHEEIRAVIEQLAAEGVEFSACRACAERLGAVERLEELGIEVRYWGESLTRLIQEKAPLITI